MALELFLFASHDQSMVGFGSEASARRYVAALNGHRALSPFSVRRLSQDDTGVTRGNAFDIAAELEKFSTSMSPTGAPLTGWSHAHCIATVPSKGI